MSQFTNILIISPYADGKTWYLQTEFRYDIGSENSGNSVVVPPGFTTDFASIPRLFWTILPKWGKYGNAAVIHDYLYFDQTGKRKDADKIFLEAMGVLHVPALQKYPIYYAVRWFGFIAWYSNRQRKKRGLTKFAKNAPVKSVEFPEHWKKK